MNEVKKNTLVRISESDYQKLEEYMKKENRSFSYLVSESVKTFIESLEEEKVKKNK